jgi:hypothetical protein
VGHGFENLNGFARDYIPCARMHQSAYDGRAECGETVQIELGGSSLLVTEDGIRTVNQILAVERVDTRAG